MPSAHGPIFCQIQVRENIGVNIRFFIGLFKCTLIFYPRQKSGLPYDFLKVGAHDPIFMCTMKNRGRSTGHNWTTLICDTKIQ